MTIISLLLACYGNPSNQFGAIVRLIAQTLVVGEDPPQLRIVALALIDPYADKLPLHKRMTPLAAGAYPLAKKRRDCRLELDSEVFLG
jgi:hypothetical protein